MTLLLAHDLHWHLRIQSTLARPNPTTEELLDATADGASNVTMFVCGWFPSLAYVMCWVAFIEYRDAYRNQRRSSRRRLSRRRSR